MARPIKNNADYFSHDSDMRNDLKIKALRRKFKHLGYSVYNMFLEVLTNSEGFSFQLSETSIELVSADFDVDPDKLQQIIDYCILVDLFQIIDSFLRCKTLENRFKALLSKRESQRKGVIDNDNTQSKVKYSKEKETIINYRGIDISFKNFISEYKKEFGNDFIVFELWDKLTDDDKFAIITHLPKYIKALPDPKFRKNAANYIKTKTWLDYTPDNEPVNNTANEIKEALNQEFKKYAN